MNNIWNAKKTVNSSVKASSDKPNIIQFNCIILYYLCTKPFNFSLAKILSVSNACFREEVLCTLSLKVLKRRKEPILQCFFFFYIIHKYISTNGNYFCRNEPRILWVGVKCPTSQLKMLKMQNFGIFKE